MAAPAPSRRAGAESSSGKSPAVRETAPAQISAEYREAESALGQSGERRHAQHQRQSEGDGAIGAQPAVAHDLQFFLARRAAAKAVGDIGESILVQRPGDADQRGDGADSRRQGGKPDSARAKQRRAAGAADYRPGDRQARAKRRQSPPSPRRQAPPAGSGANKSAGRP